MIVYTYKQKCPTDWLTHQRPPKTARSRDLEFREYICVIAWGLAKAGFSEIAFVAEEKGEKVL